MPGIVKEIYKNRKMSRELTEQEIAERIHKTRETGKPVRFAFGHTERIIRKAICNGEI